MSTLRVDSIRGQTADGTNKYVVQVVSVDKLDAQSISQGNTNFVDISGLSLSITPKFNTSKILINVNVFISYPYDGMLRLLRGSTRIPNNTEGSTENNRGFSFVRQGSLGEGYMYSFTHLDTPATTSATTYQVQGRNNGDSTNTFYVNRLGDGTNYSACSSITAMEIAQ
tara:strand:+ start:150 stop:656 length:507 start_codon:yes stop_codon:yes gene_type:complete